MRTDIQRFGTLAMEAMQTKYGAGSLTVCGKNERTRATIFDVNNPLASSNNDGALNELLTSRILVEAGNRNSSAEAPSKYYDARSEMTMAPSVSVSTRCPLIQGAASSPTTGDSSPFFCFFAFFSFGGLILASGAVDADESPSRTFCLLGMQPI